MNQIHISQLDPIKLPLVQKLYKAFYPSAKPKKNELILVAYAEKELAAVVRLRSVEEFRLLTGMLVIPKFRGLGIGKELLTYCQNKVLSEGDFCFAYPHLENYYSEHGFSNEDAGALPDILKKMYARYTINGKQLTAMKFVNE